MKGIRPVVLWTLMSLVACERPGPPDPSEDAARQILAGARRALGVDRAPVPLRIMADASVAGPGGSFRTRIHSSSDGRVRMEQTPWGFLAGVGLSGGWQVDGASGLVDSLGAELAFVRGHELHMLALLPESRLDTPRVVPDANMDGRPVLAVAMSLPSRDSLVVYYDPSDTVPLGLRVTWTEPDVEVGWSGWSVRGGVRIFEQADFRQGVDVFRYTFDSVRVGLIHDSIFEPSSAGDPVH